MSNQTIITRKTNFTVVDNGFINDPSLSWRAKGILLYMLSKPAGWKYNPKGDMLKKATDGQRSLYAGITELINAGYISRTRSKDGFLTYHVFEDKNDNTIKDYSAQVVDIKPDQQNVDQPYADQPNVDQRNVDVLVNTEGSNTEYSNTDSSKPPLPPTEGNNPKLHKTEKKKSEPKDSRFNDWYSIYPKKVAKEPARKAWIRDKLDDRADELIHKLSQQIANCQTFTNKTYIVNPQRYLNEQRYNDDVIPVKKSAHDLSDQDYGADQNVIPDWLDEARHP